MGKIIQLHLQPRDSFREAALQLLKEISPRPKLKAGIVSIKAWRMTHGKQHKTSVYRR